MQQVIPTFYSEYGRYISRFRMIPLDIDGLLPVERRLLLVMYEIARNNLVKSAKIVGTLIGSYHPHGEQSSYGTLVNLVRSGFGVSNKSTWGGPGLEDTSAPAMRYTETKLEDWVRNFAFEYIDFVPWDVLEFEKEPLFLPCILPIGLIGDGVINGISFHKTLIPKYSKADLATRLFWLLNNEYPGIPKTWPKRKLDEKKYGPVIIPQKLGCDVVEGESNAFYKLLLAGEGIVKYCPKLAVSNNKNKAEINILGRAPNATFEPILRAYEKNKLPLSDKPSDQSKRNNISISLEPKRTANINELITTLQEDYLNKNINFKCYFSNLSGTVNQVSIDTLLLNCFHNWKKASIDKLNDDIVSINTEIVDNVICARIKEILHKNNKIMSVQDIIKNFSFDNAIKITIFEDNVWKDIGLKMDSDRVIKVCRHVSIQKLVEFQSVEEQLKEKFKDKQSEIVNHEKIVLKRVEELSQNEA